MFLKKLQFYIQATSFFRVPLLFFCFPKVISLTPSAKVKIPLNWFTKNHYRSMYFGALCMGAELSIALPLLNEMFIQKKRLQFIFKDFQADFIKRADDHVIFEFANASEVLDLLADCEQQKTRLHKNFLGKAYSEKDPTKIYMTYNIAISVKIP